jgi:hypothetical protein
MNGFQNNTIFHDNIWSIGEIKHYKGFQKLTTKFADYKKMGFF